MPSPSQQPWIRLAAALVLAAWGGLFLHAVHHAAACCGEEEHVADCGACRFFHTALVLVAAAAPLALPMAVAAFDAPAPPVRRHAFAVAASRGPPAR